MAKIKALITLVISKNKQIAPNGICDVTDIEAKRLISLGYAESVKKNNQQPINNQEIKINESDGNSGEQFVQQTGQNGNIQE